MKRICEMCGRSSDVEGMECPHCGSSFEEQQEFGLDSPAVLRWGWGRLNLMSLAGAGKHDAIAWLRNEWMEMERLTIQGLIQSQASAFFEAAEQVEVLTRDDHFGGFCRRAKQKFPELVWEFRDIPDEIATADQANAILTRRRG